MKFNKQAWLAVSACAFAGVLLLGSLPANAGTVAYWRFEKGPADARIDHLADANNVWSPDVLDSSGNGNHLSAFTDDAWGNSVYKTDVPFSVVPGTGAPNNYSIKNAGGYPGMWNESLQTWSPAAWTVEASFKPENGGWRTIVGRDSKGAGTQPGADINASAMYFQLQPGNRAAITFQDVMGFQHTARSAENVVQGFDWGSDPDGLNGRWYSMAGVSDGKMLRLYLRDDSLNTGYQLIAQTDLTLSGSLDTRLTTGLGSGNDWKAGNFSVGRGMYNGGHGDRAYGFIDEVRLSEGALAPGALLGIPEPGTLALLGMGALGLIRRRRTK